MHQTTIIDNFKIYFEIYFPGSVTKEQKLKIVMSQTLSCKFRLKLHYLSDFSKINMNGTTFYIICVRRTIIGRKNFVKVFTRGNVSTTFIMNIYEFGF